jgi:tetratricopeptide (TPR) repeat protein
MRKQDRCVDTEAQDAETVDRAVEVLQQLDLEEAERLLRPVIANTPKHYVNEFEQGGKRYVKFWDLAEFTAYSTRQIPSEPSQIIWLGNAYPRAHFYMAFVCVERHPWDEAIRWLDAGMKLEPGQPHFRIEKARVLSAVGKHDNALRMYESVLEDARALAPSTRAVALRGRGFQLIELGRLDEAELCFLTSLEDDPESPVARNELTYIHHLRAGGEAAPQESVVTGPDSPTLACAGCGTEVPSALDRSDRVLCEGCTQRGSAVHDCGCIATQVLYDDFAVVVVKDPCTAHIAKKDVIQQHLPPDSDPVSVYRAGLHTLYFGKTGGRESGPPLKYADRILSGLAADRSALLDECKNHVVHAAVAAMASNIVRRGKH